MVDENKDKDVIEVSEEELEKQEGKFFEKEGQIYVREEKEPEEKSTEEDEKFDEEGFNEKGFDKDGFNVDGFDEKGFNVDGFDDEGFDADGFDEEGKDADGNEKIADDDDLTGTEYEGKTPAEIARMHKQALRQVRTVIKTEKVEDVVKDANYYEKELEKVESKLLDLTKHDDDYKPLTMQKNKLERRYAAAHNKEVLDTNVNAGKNVDFIEKKKADYDKLELDITPEEFDRVTSHAEKYMEAGRLTDRSFTKGLIDEFGQEKVVKFFTVKGEQDARKKIKDAGKKTVNKVSTKTKQKSSMVKMRNLSSMSQRERQEYLDSLTPAELDLLYEKRTQK